MPNPPSIETARLRLLPWESRDWLQLKPIAQDPEVMRYISNGQPWPDEGLKRIVAIAQPENRASIRVMEKLGMRFERETTHRGFTVVLYAINKGAETGGTMQTPL